MSLDLILLGLLSWHSASWTANQFAREHDWPDSWAATAEVVAGIDVEFGVDLWLVAQHAYAAEGYAQVWHYGPFGPPHLVDVPEVSRVHVDLELVAVLAHSILIQGRRPQ